jgi:periplasmic divalent cation tolerance protein
VQPLLVLTTLPDSAVAEALAAKLIAEALAACVSIGSPIRSLYHWQGKTETASEIPMTIKTTAGAYAEVEAAIRALHPYELPEIIAVPITAGLTPYLDWIAASVDRSGECTDA